MSVLNSCLFLALEKNILAFIVFAIVNCHNIGHVTFLNIIIENLFIQRSQRRRYQYMFLKFGYRIKTSLANEPFLHVALLDHISNILSKVEIDLAGSESIR